MNQLKKYFTLETEFQYKKTAISLAYLVAIGGAFVFSVINSRVNASVSAYNDIDFSFIGNQLESSMDLNQSLGINSIESIKHLVDLVSNPEKKTQTELKIGKGDTFINLLTQNGIPYSSANEFYLKFKKIYDPKNLKIGQSISIFSTIDRQTQDLVSVDKIIIDESIGVHHILEKNAEGTYTVNTAKDTFTVTNNSASGVINGNLSAAMSFHSVPSSVIADFINIFSFSVDFRKDLRQGDKFEIIYEKHIAPNGQTVKNGNILYASLTLRKDKIALYRFKNSKGAVDYYDEKGLPMKKTLSKKPLAFSKARISSPFGKRRHPIHKDIRIHWGIDYAAPSGTPIFAAGDGVVIAAKWNGGYGKYIKIRHNSEYATAYGHMKSFAKGITVGSRVKQGQIIAYVGSTGRSTGPHLHYEVIKGRKRVNPLIIKASTGEQLKANEMTKFKQTVASIKALEPKMFAVTTKKTDKKS